MEILAFLKKSGFLILGHATVALGFIGIFVPGLPTVPFLLVALWAYARSCPHFHTWLLEHKRFGPLLSDWQNHGVIPMRAKIIALATMLGSLAICFSRTDNLLWPAILGFVLSCSATFILTRPSKPSTIEKNIIKSEAEKIEE